MATDDRDEARLTSMRDLRVAAFTSFYDFLLPTFELLRQLLLTGSRHRTDLGLGGVAGLLLPLPSSATSAACRGLGFDDVVGEGGRRHGGGERGRRGQRERAEETLHEKRPFMAAESSTQRAAMRSF